LITGNKRFRIFLTILLAVTFILVLQYARIMLISPPLSPLDTPSFPELQRGEIYDRNGKLMAIQTRLDSVTAWIPEIKDNDRTAALLADALSLDREDLKVRFNDASRQGFLYIKRQVSPTESKLVNEMIQSRTLPGIRL
jgi:cell division protein FtsI (penicillin-binding protein 3)